MFEDRGVLERQFSVAALAQLRAEAARREKTPSVIWPYTFANNPRGFLRELIGPEWDTPDWMAWRAFVSTVFAQPLASIGEHRIFAKSTLLQEPPDQRPTKVWMPIGRRGGKSRILAGIAVYLGCCFDWSPYLDPGEVGVIPVLAVDRRQSQVIMGYVKAFLQHPELRDRVVREMAETVDLAGSVRIEVATASYKAVRSRTILAALCDEIAFWESEESSSNPDTEIIAALEPAMATIPNALLLGASSPYARRGVLWNAFDRYFGRDEGPLVWRADTRTMNPTIPQSFIDEKYQDDPISAAAEYGAEFRTDVDAFVTREVIDSAVERGVHERPPQPQVRYAAFIDPSGGSSDSMTLAIAHRDANNQGILDCLRERRPPFSPEGVVVEFAEVMRSYGITRAGGDHYAGQWPRERFRLSGISYQVSKLRKSDIYRDFLPLLNGSRVDLLDNPRANTQLLRLERRIARGGRETIDHPPGSNDDLANVIAGVMVNVLTKRAVFVSDEVLEQADRIVTRGVPDPVGPVWR